MASLTTRISALDHLASVSNVPWSISAVLVIGMKMPTAPQQ
jgi:hypothetical protein